MLEAEAEILKRVRACPNVAETFGFVRVFEGHSSAAPGIYLFQRHYYHGALSDYLKNC